MDACIDRPSVTYDSIYTYKVNVVNGTQTTTKVSLNLCEEQCSDYVNLADGLTPTTYYGPSVTVTTPAAGTYHFKNGNDSAGRWFAWGYNLSAYIGKYITFSGKIKNSTYTRRILNSKMMVGQANTTSSPYDMTMSTNSITIATWTNGEPDSLNVANGTPFYWTGKIVSPGILILEDWVDARGWHEFDLYDIKIEEHTQGAVLSFNPPANKLYIEMTPESFLDNFRVRITKLGEDWDINSGILAYQYSDFKKGTKHTFNFDINSTNFPSGDGIYRISMYARDSYGTWDTTCIFTTIQDIAGFVYFDPADEDVSGIEVYVSDR